MSLWHTSYLYLAACVAAAPAEGGGAQVDHASVRAALTASSAIALHGTGGETLSSGGAMRRGWARVGLLGSGARSGRAHSCTS